MVQRVLVLTVLTLLMVPRAAIHAQAPQPTAGSIDPRIAKLVESVSEQRLQQLLTKLVSFGTRNTLSDQASTTRGIGAARQWIYDELKRTSPKLQVSFDTHQIPARGRITRDVELRNVMAILPGRTPRRIYVSGHYDSLNLGAGGQQTSNSGAGGRAGAGQDSAQTPPAAGGRGGQAAPTRPGAEPQAPGEPPAPNQQRPARDPTVVAPGANDDGSGTVLSMELARVFAESGIHFDATLV